MSAFLGEIRIFAGNFAPYGWVFCNGQLLSIAENDALYSLIGTTYGGDGVTNFAVPDFRGRIPVHQGSYAGNTFIIGEMAGSENVTLISTQIPAHSHPVFASSNDGTVNGPGASGLYPAKDPTGSNIYSDSNTDTMVQSIVRGSSFPHDNMPPYLCLNYIIAVEGIYPTRP